MKVRQAKIEDYEWLIENVKTFFEWSGYGQLYDEEYTPVFVQNLMSHQLVLVAEHDGKLVGFIIGNYGPHPYNPKKTMLSELAWWVMPEYRRTSAGAALLATYVGWGKKHADIITMCTLTHSPLNEGTLAKRGFKPKETCYIWEK